MTGEVIKSFLVGLGFDVDDESLAKFNKSIATATLRIGALYGAIKLTGAGILFGLSKISEGFEQIGYEYKILAPAINKALVLRQEMFKAYAATGINLTQVVQASARLNLSLTKTKYVIEAIYRSVGSRFFELLTKQSDTFRNKIYANMPKIQKTLERFIKIVFKALEVTTDLGMRLYSILSRVYDFFVALDKATNGWSTIVLGMVAAWQAFNLSFLATPLGLVLTGLLAILALYDDFKVWQEGGKSFFDWSSFVPVINAVTAALKSMWGVLQSIADTLATIVLSMIQLFKGDFAGAWDSLKQVFSEYLIYLTKIWETFKGLLGVLDTVGNWAVKTALNITPGGVPDAAPARSPTPSSSQNQNYTLQQQTSIYTQPGADAQQIGKASSSDTKRNFNTTRNLQGNTR